TYDGDSKPASATTDPAGLSVAITYDGNAAAPSAAGSYAVEATVTDPNYAGTASGALVIDASYLSWIEAFFSPAPDALLDSDGDGWLNLAEYLFDTDPSQRSSLPSVTSVFSQTTLALQLSPTPLARPDASLGAQTSINLLNWTTEGVNATPSGFSVPNDSSRRFLKLTYTLFP
ncbi:MAG: hypothetical protein ACI8XO_004209, partial [Verrucomicrobiales bacterium]